MATDRKVVLVTRRTRLEELIARFHTEAQARFYVEHLGADFADYQAEHATYTRALGTALRTLRHRCRVQTLDRVFVPTYLFAPDDLVIALGQDGLVANTLKYLDGQPLVGVNPDPKRYDGVLLPFQATELSALVTALLADERPVKTVTMAKATLSDGQTLHAVNDFFIGPKSHTSTRYEIELKNRRETQSSSGVIVATGLGSTAWLKSIVTSAALIAGAVRTHEPTPWDAPFLEFAVREAFPSVTTQAKFVRGKVDRDAPLVLRSLMPENGVIFSDGIEADFLAFTSGITAKITVADRVGRLVV